MEAVGGIRVRGVASEANGKNRSSVPVAPQYGNLYDFEVSVGQAPPLFFPFSGKFI